jgi:DNA-binding NtrC family response regulator
MNSVMTDTTQDKAFADVFLIEPTSVDESDRRILIVDDEEPIRNLFASCLGERYSCVTAADAQAALALLAGETFALVISDVQMPGLSGVELCGGLQSSFRIPPSSWLRALTAQRVLDAVRLGAFDYLLKPCDMDVLELSVERALEKRALARCAALQTGIGKSQLRTRAPQSRTRTLAGADGTRRENGFSGATCRRRRTRTQ